MALTMVVGMLLVMQAGCSKKSIQSGGDAQSSERGMAKSGAPAQSQAQLPTLGLDAPSATFPDLSCRANRKILRPAARGFDSVSGGKAPSEERLGRRHHVGKVEPSESTARQIEEIRREQAKGAGGVGGSGLRDVFFGYDSWTITEEGRQSLTQDAQWIKANAGALVKIEGAL